MKRRYAYGIAALVLLASVAIGGYGLYKKRARVPMDLRPLNAFGATLSYASQIRALEGAKPPVGGFSFVVLGDTRSNFAIAKRVLARAAQEKPAFILATGDLVRFATVAEYLEHFIPLVKEVAMIPLISVPGNHDEGPNRDFATFKAIYGGERFSFAYGGCRFVGINNSERWVPMSGEDLDYLRRELARTPATHKFVVMHVPPRYLEEAIPSKRPRGFRWNASDFRRYMKDYGVDQAFSGHIHGFASVMIDDVRYTITAGAGAPLSSYLGPEGSIFNFVLVRVGPDGVRTEVLRLVNDQWIRSGVSE